MKFRRRMPIRAYKYENMKLIKANDINIINVEGGGVSAIG